MKEILYSILALIILPFILIGGFICGLLYVLNLMYKYYYMFFKTFMLWVDKHVTRNL